MSTKEEIIAELQSELAAITQANGYQTDIGANVFLWKNEPPEPAEMPCLMLSYDKVASTYEGVCIGYQLNTLPVDIVAASLGNPDDAAPLAIEQGVVACLSKYPVLNGKADRLFIDDIEVMLGKHEVTTCARRFIARIEYETPLGVI